MWVAVMREKSTRIWIFFGGVVLGTLMAAGIAQEEDDRAHDRGYAEGLDACKVRGPSRLERAAKWAVR